MLPCREEEKPKDGEGQGKATTDESNPPAPKRQRVEKLGPPKTGLRDLRCALLRPYALLARHRCSGFTVG